LSDLKEETFIRLIQKVSRKKIEKGEVLFEAGSLADAMYVVVEGKVVARTEGPLELDLATMKEGDFFGEIGLLAQERRQATIVALEDTELLVFEQDLLLALEESEPDFIRILLRFVRERLVASLIAKNPLFAAFSDQEAEELTRRFQFLEVSPRKALVHQGEKSEGLFLLLTGSAEVVQTQDGQTKTLGQLGPGEIFGEMSLLSREPVTIKFYK
jgi:CRP-like cAMP-binding protein